MLKVKRKEKSKKTKSSINIFSFMFAAILVYFMFTMYNQQISINKYNSQIEMYKSEIDNKQKLLNVYGQKENNITNDEYIEQVARESLGLVKPYEKIFVDINK